MREREVAGDRGCAAGGGEVIRANDIGREGEIDFGDGDGLLDFAAARFDLFAGQRTVQLRSGRGTCCGDIGSDEAFDLVGGVESDAERSGELGQFGNG